MSKNSYYKDNKIKEVLSKELHLNKKDISFDSEIIGGMSNETFLYKDINSKKYAVHYSTSGYDLFVKRAAEYDALDKLKDLKIIQKPVYLSNKLRIFEYVEGTPLNQMDYKAYYANVSESFKKLHNSNKLFKYNYNPFKYIKYIEKLDDIEFNDLYYKSMDILNKNKKELEKRKLYPCHNDLQPTNLVLTENNEIHILDFEFAKNNDYLFDIASFGNIDFNDSLNLIKIYNPNYTENDIKILKLWRIYINCLWYLVALKKELMGYSSILKLDFNEIAMYFLSKNKAIIETL